MGKAKVDLHSVTTVGLDLAKQVFQIHAMDVDGRIVIASALRRKDVLSFFSSLPPCVIGLEACGSAHHWARELVKLGHDARLMPPNYVKAYVRRQKNDAADAVAICEAVTRPSMRFVPIRSVSNQAILMCHKVRELLVSQRTQLVNALCRVPSSIAIWRIGLGRRVGRRFGGSDGEPFKPIGLQQCLFGR